MFFFVIMKKFGFKIVFLNLDLLPIKGTLIIHSYFSARNIEKIQNYLNCQHKNIRSTSETEKKSSISFFDIKMSRSNNKFATSIHRKPTDLDFYQLWKSHPKVIWTQLAVYLRAFKLWTAQILEFFIWKLTS